MMMVEYQDQRGKFTLSSDARRELYSIIFVEDFALDSGNVSRVHKIVKTDRDWVLKEWEYLTKGRTFKRTNLSLTTRIERTTTHFKSFPQRWDDTNIK